ncbi:MAG: hypothetical protein CSA54_05295 [Gammaproteobacteria bacterium]|nr:MAG: hypothetical protein CSA54_05295 [Gammaproteobacteria bacterium]
MPKYTMRDGQEMNVIEIGRGEPVVLLHGLALDATSWLPYASTSLLNKRFYIPDLRGWGKSRHMEISEDFYFGQLADDVHDLIQKIGAPKVALVGISMGACVGLEYLKRHGDSMLSRYLHIDHPAHLDRDINPDALPPGLVDTGMAMIEEARYFDPKTSIAQLPASYLHKHFQLIFGVLRNSFKRPWHKAVVLSLEYNPIARKTMSEYTSAGCWYATLRAVQAAASGEFDVRAGLPDITIPVTNLVGTHDTLFPLGELKAVSTLLPNCKTIEFHESGHLLMITEIPKFLKVFRAFLAENEHGDSYQFPQQGD